MNSYLPNTYFDDNRQATIKYRFLNQFYQRINGIDKTDHCELIVFTNIIIY